MSIKNTIERFFHRVSQFNGTPYSNVLYCSLSQKCDAAFKLPKHLKIGFGTQSTYGAYLVPIKPLCAYPTLGKTYHTAIRKYGLLECLPFVVPNNPNTTVLISPACAFIKETLDLLFWVTNYDNIPTLFITTKCFEETTPTSITHFIRKLLIPNVQAMPIQIVPNCKVLAPNQLKEEDVFRQDVLISKIETNMQLKENVEEQLKCLNDVLYVTIDPDTYECNIYPILKSILFHFITENYENMYLAIRNLIITFLTLLSQPAIERLQLLLLAIKPLLKGNAQSNRIVTPSNTLIDLTYTY